MRLQIIVTTMHQSDMSLLEKMRIKSDVVIANQADSFGIEEKELEGGKALMVTTNSRGLSRNRNIGLEFLSKESDYVMFLDDDLILEDGYAEMIQKEFEAHPEADAIKFNLFNISKTRQISMDQITKYKKATRRNISSSGVCGVCISKQVMLKHNMKFNELFGAGTPNFCGEDTIFLQELLNKGVKLYLSPVTIAGIDQSESSWFAGYTEKFFTVGGMVFAACYPKLSRLLALRSAYRFSKRGNSKLTFAEILKCYIKGINDYKKL